MLVSMIMVMVMIIRMGMAMIVGQMNIEFYSGNSRFFLARNVEVITIKPQFLQLMFEAMRVDAEIQQRSQKHIATDAAEDIEVKDFHKFQAPTSKLQRNSKSLKSKHSAAVRVFGAWRLELLWSLGLGIWNFIGPPKH